MTFKTWIFFSARGWQVDSGQAFKPREKLHWAITKAQVRTRCVLRISSSLGCLQCADRKGMCRGGKTTEMPSFERALNAKLSNLNIVRSQWQFESKVDTPSPTLRNLTTGSTHDNLNTRWGTKNTHKKGKDLWDKEIAEPEKGRQNAENSNYQDLQMSTWRRGRQAERAKFWKVMFWL